MSDAIREMYQRWQDGYAFCEDSDYDVELAERVDAELASPPAEALPSKTSGAEAGGEAMRPEDEAEHFIQAAIDSAPEPLRRLGEWLANKLDDDDWKTADRLITSAAVAVSALSAELDQALGLIADRNAELAALSSAPAQEDGSKDLGAHPRAVPTSLWQDIATAPKGSSHVLLFGNQAGQASDVHWEGSFVTSGYWDGVDEAWCATGSNWTGPFIEPTHWMPLPEPPKALEKGPATLADATNNPVPLTLSDAGSDAEGRGHG